MVINSTRNKPGTSSGVGTRLILFANVSVGVIPVFTKTIVSPTTEEGSVGIFSLFLRAAEEFVISQN